MNATETKIKNIINNYKNSETIEDLVKMSKEITQIIKYTTSTKKEEYELINKYSSYIIDFHLKK